MSTDFENELIERLTRIETEIKSFSSVKEQTYNNMREIMLINTYIEDLKKKNQNVTGLLITIIGALIIAFIRYQLHF